MRPLFTLLLCLCFYALFAQQRPTLLTLKAGYTAHNINYSSDFLRQVVPPTLSSSYWGEDSERAGLSLGLGIDFPVGKRFRYFIYANYLTLGSDMETYLPISPLSPIVSGSANVPVYIDGRMTYHYVGIETGLSYYPKGDNSGWMIGLVFRQLSMFQTSWEIELQYANSTTLGRLDDISEIEQPKYNSSYVLGLQLGYQLWLSDFLAITPILDISNSVNPIREDKYATLGLISIGGKASFSF